MRPGIYQIPAAEYHADPCPEPSLSSSIANILLTRSPYHAYMHHPKLGDAIHEESSRFDLGKAAHSMLLENNDTSIEVIQADDWRTKEAKTKRDEARLRGKTPMLEHHYIDVIKMVQAAREFIAKSELAGIFDNGLAEQTIIWREGDLWCRARPDYLTLDWQINLDYKTATCAEPDYFGRHMANMGYDVQQAFYQRGLRAIGGGPTSSFVFLAQEIEPPYACSLHSLSSLAIDMAEEKVERAIADWGTCLRSGIWPSYPHNICYQQPPAWAVNRYMERMELENGVPV